MRLAAIFQDHAVLQRDVPIPLWGTAAPGCRVEVRLGPRHAAMTTGTDGRWLLRLAPLPAGGPHRLTATAEGHPPVVLEDLLVGEVWIGSGQSNMAFLLSQVDPDGEQSRGVVLPRVRMLTVWTPAGASPQVEVAGRWTSADPESIARFSAVAGWFGRILHAELDVPVGLIVNAWGGSRIQAWLSREALMLDPAGRAEIAAYEPLLL